MAAEKQVLKYDCATVNNLLDTVNENKSLFPFDTALNASSQKGLPNSVITKAINAIKDVTSNNKGYFLSLEKLKAAYPTANEGSKAYVGSNYPYQIYLYETSMGGWHDTGETGGDDTFNVGEFYTRTEIDQQHEVINNEIARVEKGANYEVLQYEVNIATTRLKVPEKNRKAGYMITYNPGTGWIKELYTGVQLTNEEWIKDENWKVEIPSDDIQGVAEEVSSLAESAASNAALAQEKAGEASQAAEQATQLVSEAQQSITEATEAAGEANAAAEAAREAVESIGEKQGAGKPVGENGSEVFNNLTDNSVEGAAYAHAGGNVTYAWGDHSFVDGTGDKTPSEQSSYPKVYPDSTIEEFKALYEQGLRPQIAKGEYSRVSGKHNLAYGDFSIVHGSYNKDYGYSNYLFGVGITAREFFRNCMFVGASRENITADDYDKVTGTDVEGDVASSCLFIGNTKDGTVDNSPKLSNSIIVSPAEIFGYAGIYDFNGTIHNSIMLNRSNGATNINALNSILINCFSSEQRTDCICIGDVMVLDRQQLRCTHTDHPNSTGIGFGYNVTINGNSIGMDSQIENSSTTATMGSIAIGTNNTANTWSAAFGANNIARTQTTFCAGDSNIAYTIHSIAMGIQSVSLGDYSVAIGGGGLKLSENNIEPIMSSETPDADLLEAYSTKYYSSEDSYHVAYGKGAVVMGKNNLALGNYSSAHGEGNVAYKDHQFIVGKFGQYKENIAFAVGWGTYYGNRLNVFEVLNDGNANLKGTLNQSSDIRLKENVKDLESKGSLRIAEFDWKNGNGHSYGFIADEVEKIYPDMVSEDSSGYKVLNYNAAMCAKLAELEATIKKQQEMIDKLEKLIQK